jgi:probable rRNA maturation factor
MLTSQNKVNLHFQKSNTSLRDRRNLKKFIQYLFNAEGIKLAGLSYIFCSDEYLLDLNQRFLGHDFYTDTVSFLLSENARPVTGEVYISLDRIRDNAASFGVSIKEEIHRVIFHGALHLCGYNDKTRHRALEMKQKENYYLERYLRRKGSTNHSFRKKH